MSDKEKQEIANAIRNGYQLIHIQDCIFDIMLLHSKRLLIFADTYNGFIESLTAPESAGIEP